MQVFLETGRALKIIQTEHGFFVSLDRSVVEEFSFGENRTVSVGPIEAQRVSGWEGLSYIVETVDDDSAILREEWRLAEGGGVLLRNVSISQRGTEHFSLLQRFERQ